ncbi:sensor histidine kinase [Nonomuraea sp. NN258]|uniref:ATP-binding protein n=1 Tax=Nonomuraea antri TaxID=2730852 RepID=UPI00156A2C27|nr:sensor histidine kinase [Nonomuraea antri]NRQ39443.1 sensor histidine kinase [Nonomuraea antri]
MSGSPARRGERRRLAPVIAWTVAAVSLVSVLLAAWMIEQVPWDSEVEGVDPVGLLFPAAGAFLISRAPGARFPWILWGTGVVWSVYALNYALVQYLWSIVPGHPLIPYLAWPAVWMWLWAVPVFAGVMPLLFPDGRLPSRRWRPLLYGNFALMIGHSLLLGLSPDVSFELNDLPIPNPLGVEALGDLPYLAESWIGLPMITLSALGVLSLWFRHRAATPELRRQIAWYFYSMMIFTGYWLLSGGREGLWLTLRVTLAVLIPLSIIAAVLRYQLYGIKLILNRTLVYGALAVVGGLTYSALIWAADRVSGDYGAVAGLAAAMATAAVFHPLRLRLQASVDRLFNVERDPYKAADLLSRTVQQAEDPSEALADALSVVRAALGARGAAVQVYGEPVVSFADGELGGRSREVELTWHGERVGRLSLAGARQGRERQLVMAKHLAELAHAVRLSTDLRDSHERINATRDEERRRLGRELHDGLGPTLTSVTMTLDEARRRLGRDPQAADRLLLRVREEMTSTLNSVRELVDGLRPPALDELGLAGALAELGRAPGPRVSVEPHGPLDDLPPAVELAAYRIVQEALTNARRHARADRVAVTLRREPESLRVTVTDDGAGLPDTPSPGVGLTSMRERAAEIGGTCAIGPRAGGGTEVAAVLPIA